jgi:hypothetical protein
MAIDDSLPMSAIARQRLRTPDVSRLLIAAYAIRASDGSCVEVEREIREAAAEVLAPGGRGILAGMAILMGCTRSDLPRPRPSELAMARRVLQAAQVPTPEPHPTPGG